MGRVSTCQKNCKTIDLRGAQVNNIIQKLQGNNLDITWQSELFVLVEDNMVCFNGNKRE